MKKKQVKMIRILIAVIIALICFMLLFRFVIQPSELYQTLNELVKQQGDGLVLLDNRSKDSDKPFALTANQTYGAKLVESDAINVLLLGPDASGSNYDTLMIVSMQPDTGVITLINLPRDIFIDYSDDVKARMKKAFPKYASSKGIYKINAAHLFGKKIKYLEGEGRFGNPEYDFTADLIQEVFDIYVDDYMIVKTSSFRKVVDYFGGVDIEVPYRMKYADPIQNLSIDLKKGMQHLDGTQAEGFVRFRQGYTDSGKFKSFGDLERKKNQNAFINAFIAQHLTLKNAGKFISISNDLDQYLDTSVKGSKKVAAYAKIAEKLLKSGLKQDTIPIGVENFTLDGIYYLKLTPEKVSE